MVDTHCHLNMIIKKDFDRLLTMQEIADAEIYVAQARQKDVLTIINVGTSLQESINCVSLAQRYSNLYAVVGIHPNDCTDTWRHDLKEIVTIIKKDVKKRIVGIGECGLDKHYPDYNLKRQQDAFRYQIDMALTYKYALVIHTRDAREETYEILEEYAQESLRAVIHCFSENKDFADYCIQRQLYLGIGGTITYPKNEYLRDIVRTMPLKNMVLETDAPFLPPQWIRGKVNNPAQIASIAEFIANLRQEKIEIIREETTQNAGRLFLQKDAV